MNRSSSISQTPAQFLKAMSIIHIGMLVAQVLFSLVVIYLNSNRETSSQPSDTPFLYVVPVMAVVCFLLGRLIFDKMLSKAKAQDSLKEKAMNYQGAFLVRLAFLEAPSLFGIVTYFLTGNILLLSVSLLIILYFFTLRPSKERVSSDLSLDYHQQKQFDSSDEVMP